MKKMFVIVLALLVIAMFVVSGCAPGSFTGNAKYAPSAKKSTAKYPDPDHFEVMKARFVSLGVSEDEMWKKFRSSNVILYEFQKDKQAAQIAFALRQINDPKVDAAIKKASKEWMVSKFNKKFVSSSAEDMKNIAWLITAENSLKAVSLGLPQLSSDLPLDPEGLKAYLDKTGEGGAAGSAAGAGGSGGAAASGGKSASTVKMGGSFAGCVQGAAAKSLTGDGNRPKTPEKKTAGGKPSVTDGSGDSTTTEGGSSEGKSTLSGPCGTVDWNAAKGGNGGISEEGDKPVGDGSGETVNTNQKELDKNSFDVTGTTPDGTDVQSSFEAEEVYKVNGKVTVVNGKLDGKDVSLTPDGINKAFKDGQDWFKNNKVTTSSTFKGSNVKSGQNQANPLEGSDGATNNCASAVSACASTPGQFFGANAQLKQLAQDCLNEAGKGGSKGEITGGATTTTEGSSSFSDPQKPAPSACDKVSPGCMKELSKGPVINPAGEASSCFALSGDALGFSKQMMVTDPVDLVGKLGMISQAAQTSQTAQKASTGSASKAATGTASTGKTSAGATDQKAAAGSGECGGEACA